MTTTLSIKPLTETDIYTIWTIGYTQDSPKWKQYAAPYFDDYQPYNCFDDFQTSDEYAFLSSSRVQGIFLGDQPIGFVSYYWEYEKTRWLEIGITIFEAKHWNGGYGSTALKHWIAFIFQTIPKLEHIGLTTWSGNPGMMKAAEKAGMSKEAHIRKVRYWQGTYYDSVKYGILKEEWFVLTHPH